VSLLEAIYRDSYWQHASQRPDSKQEHYDSEFIANLIAKYQPSARKVIEIGCGPGSLIFGLNKRGYEVQGHDASNEAAKIAKEIYGLGVTVGSMAELPPILEADVVVMRHVVEHSRKPCDELRVLMRSLKKHSIIIVITPNIECGLACTMGASWEWFVPPVHLSYFSPLSLAMLAFTEDFKSLLIDTRKGDGIAAGEVLPFFHSYSNKELNAPFAMELTKAREFECAGFVCALPELSSDNEVIAVLQKQ
jgi:2-polyprenyl-3-methyl-5-hydroxy-6-metoxy-1,4-benzoquinol methylase